MTLPIIVGIVLAFVLYYLSNRMQMGRGGRVMLFGLGLVVGFFATGVIQAMLK